MATIATTHAVEFSDGVITKRFRNMNGGEPEREWQALQILATHAPGLAPQPLRADLGATPPTVVMSRLPGHSLGLEPLGPAELEAYAASVNRLHGSVPQDVLDGLTTVAWPPATALALVNRMRNESRPALDDPLVHRAFTEATTWLASGWAENAAAVPATAVFGHGDGNLANYLWDGLTVRIVDFEDAGRSDRAFELADSVEHLAVWLDGNVAPDQFLAQFDLSARDRARVHGYRRLFAIYWFLRLQPGLSAHKRNPPGTLTRQTERLLTLLDTPAPSTAA